MNSATSLRWISARALQAVQQAAQEAASLWARAWGLPEPEPATVQAATSWPAAEATGLGLAATEPAPHSWTEALTSALFAGETSGSAIAPAVTADATNQLRQALCRALGLDHTAETARDADRPVPGQLGVTVHVTVLNHRWWARVPHAALERQALLRVPRPAPVPRWNAEQALAATPVPLQAVLGHVTVDVLDVLHLSHGDVLLLPRQGLDAAVQVQGIGTPLQLSARLGAAAGVRAVQWQAPTNTTH